MELSSDPTPKLKSSPVPVLFIPFNNNEDKCNFCNHKYSITLLYEQKYCKSCFFWYVKYTTGNDINEYLDVRIRNNIQCIGHEAIKNTDFIQEWCEYFSDILYFKQVSTIDANGSVFYDSGLNAIERNEIIESENVCKLCARHLKLEENKYQGSFNDFDAEEITGVTIQVQQEIIDRIEFKLCSNCYLISSELIESALTNKPIPIIYLPWWNTHNQCVVCKSDLEFISDCQKYCLLCYIIYTGCRYCLTTNIILGITNQSQCRKCKRISFIAIDITNINSGSIEVEEFLISTRLSINNEKIVNYINNIDVNSNPLVKYITIKDELKNAFSKPRMEWIPYSHIKDFKRIAEGGFGIIYKATWIDGGQYQNGDFLSIRNKNKTVAIKKFLNSQNITRYFFNELKSLYQCYSKFDHIIRCYGITRDPLTKEYMIIMEYANGGNLHDYLEKNFTNITWHKKLYILWQISAGLYAVHEENFIHRDFHSGNILLGIESVGKWKIGDLGLSQPANGTLSNNEIYGVIPYIAPEIFKGGSFSKESDIYSMGMIMWELTSGSKPFDNVEHNTELIYNIMDNERPKITEDTPECFVDLMKRCWDSNSSKRPSAKEIRELSYMWSFIQSDCEEFKQAEKKRLELIESKKLGPEFTEKPHPKAFFTSGPLISLIFSTKQEYRYISKEYEFDINDMG